ncbi:MAG: hypothetical protein Kow00109_09140 [Acidobacteriota bacterium]
MEKGGASPGGVTAVPAAGWFLLGLLRMALGWHLLYEGVTKWLTPEWSSREYLELSRWVFADFFHWIAKTPGALFVADLLNTWGLIAAGGALILGLWTRYTALGGGVLLFLYYLANPPLVGLDWGVPQEGNYLIVNKTLVEALALWALAFTSPERLMGLDRWLAQRGPNGTEREATSREISGEAPSGLLQRRELLWTAAGIPVLGGFSWALSKKLRWQSYEEKNLIDAMTSASVKTLDVLALDDLKGTVPRARIAGREFSRIILGGNLLSGWAHSRDLIYVSQLVKAYHYKDKIFATLYLAERCGINTLLTNPILVTLLDEYWKRGIGRIQFISDCAGLNYDEKGAHPKPWNEYMDLVQKAIDYGATACYVQGETADYYISQGDVGAVEKVLEKIRSQGLPAGIGAHRIETIKACVEAGVQPDFWMKTLHHHDYWSARHPEWHDNMYCFDPEETIAYMRERPEPWIAFKVLAAGAIHPREGFRYAFENGADFVCVGMYDFQMVENVNLALDVLGQKLPRQRPWRA